LTNILTEHHVLSRPAPSGGMDRAGLPIEILTRSDFGERWDGKGNFHLRDRMKRIGNTFKPTLSAPCRTCEAASALPKRFHPTM
jgi:hypothetical protein